MTPLLAAIDPWILAFSALTVIATLWMGFRSARTSKTASDFFVAGRNVSVGWNASAISGEYLSAASFMGVAGMVMSSGYDALWYPVCYACGYLFLLLFIAGPLRRFGAYTIPDFAEGRFDSPIFRKIAVVFVLFIGFFYTMPQMKGAGTTLAYIFPGLPYWVGVVLVGVVITLNVSLGGMKGITLVQAFQYWAKMFAISVPIFVLMAVYGHYGKQVGMNGNLAVQGLKPGIEYRAAYTPQTNEVPVKSWKQRVLAMLPDNYARRMSQTEANRWGLGHTTGSMLSSPSIQLHGLLDLYGSATGKKVFIAGVSQREAVDRRLHYTTNHVFGSTMLGIIREVLRTNGVILVSEDPQEVRFAATNVVMVAERKMERGPSAGSRLPFTTALELANAFSNSPLSKSLSSIRAENALTMDDAMKSAGAAKNYAKKVLRVDPYRFSTNLPMLVELREAYAYLTRKTIFYYSDQRDEERVPFDSSPYVTSSAAASAIEGIFRTNGTSIFPLNSTQAVFLAGKQLERVNTMLASERRLQLAKAPSDDTWLNPFGPLTTKAAKAANAVPRWNINSEIRSTLVDLRNRPAPSLWESMARSAANVAEGIAGVKPPSARPSSFVVFTNMATNAIQSIPDGMPMLTALRELGLLLDQPVFVATNLPRTKLVISGSFQTRDQFVSYLSALFLTNGVRLDLSGAAIKAIGVAEPDQKDPASVIVVPNQTFAMRVGPYEERQPDGRMVLRHAEPKILLWSYSDMVGKPALMAVNLPTNGIDFNPGFEVMLAQEARSGMERTFLEQGITIIPAGKEVWAVPTADVARYQLPPVNVRALSLLYTYSLIIALVCGTAGLPHILVRFYTNPDGAAAKRTTMWVMILIGVFYLFPPVFGVMGRNLLPALYSGVGAKGTDKVVLELPRILNEVRSEKGEGRAEVVPSPLSPHPSHFPWGSILSGITCAGAFAAFMSTFSGLLVSMTGAMAHDVYGRMLRPKSTPEQRLRAFKFCAVLIGGVAIGLGCFVEPLEINFMVGQAFAIAAASYFPLLFMSVWWRGMTTRGAASGMLIGGLCALAAVTLTNVSNLALDKGPMGKVFAGFAPLNEYWGAHPLLRILCEQPAIWTVPLAIGLMLVVSKLTARSVPPDIRMKMLVLHAPEKLGLKQEYIEEHQAGH